MSYDFYIRHLDRNLVIKNSAIYDYLWLSYRRVVTGSGVLKFVLNGNHKVFTDLEDFDIFEVYWQNKELGVPWHRDFEAIYRKLNVATNNDGIKNGTITAYGSKVILSWRQVAFPSGIANRSVFSSIPAETVAKTIVEYNFTALASTFNGRIRNGDISTPYPAGMGFPINVIPDSGGGNVISKTFHKRNVLDAVDNVISPIAGGDFSLIRNGSVWDFDFHSGQLGEDKTTGDDLVEFSEDRSNVREPEITRDRTRVVTVAIGAGQGVGSDRNYQIIIGDDYLAGNDIEIMVDARNENSDAGVIESGKIALKKRRELIDFDLDVIQTESVFYSRFPVTGRKTYTVGDLVLARYLDTLFPRKISAINVAVSVPSNEDMVKIDVETVRLS